MCFEAFPCAVQLFVVGGERVEEHLFVVDLRGKRGVLLLVFYFTLCLHILASILRSMPIASMLLNWLMNGGKGKERDEREQ